MSAGERHDDMRPVEDWVDASDVVHQRELGWPDFHPEIYCHRCGGRNIPSWSVDSDRFNAAVHALGLTYTAIICPSCFVYGHEKATGLTCTWQLEVGVPFRRVECAHKTTFEVLDRGRANDAGISNTTQCANCGEMVR